MRKLIHMLLPGTAALLGACSIFVHPYGDVKHGTSDEGSWLIEGDVYDARRHMNLSRWDDYSVDKKQALLSEIAVMVRNRKMPLPGYLVLHPEAKLSDADIDQIYQWARNERRRLKTLATTQPSTSSGASQ